jgi:SRSO17 transposase
LGLESIGRGSESRFTAYVETLSWALGHADRIVPFRSYCAGLLLPGDRKSVEAMAARVEPARVQATHQSLHPAFRKRARIRSAWRGNTAANLSSMIQARTAPMVFIR